MTERRAQVFMTDSFRELWKKLDARQRAPVGEELDFYLDQVRTLARETNVYATRIQYRKGCSHCCETFVGIMPIEAELLRVCAGARSRDRRGAREAASLRDRNDVEESRGCRLRLLNSDEGFLNRCFQ